MATAEHSFPRLYKVGSVETNDPSVLKHLVQATDASTSGRYDSLDTPRGTGYTVATGKTFYITRLHLSNYSGAGTTIAVTVGYGDTRVADSVAAPTNAKVMAQYGHQTGAFGMVQIDCLIPIPAGKVPFIISTGGLGYVGVEGIEV